MLIILDKDETLVRPKSGEKFVQHPEDQELLPNVIERLREAQKAGHSFAIASNQGGVAAGHKTLEQAIEEMRHCLLLLLVADIEVERVLMATDFEGLEGHWVTGRRHWNKRKDQYHDLFTAGSLSGYENLRKPGAGMLQIAIDGATYYPGMRDRKAIMIGDRPEDEQAAIAAGIPFLDAAVWRERGLECQ